MEKTYTKPQLITLWEELFRKRTIKRDIVEVADAWPDLRSFTLTFKQIQRFDADLAIYLLEHPKVAIDTAEKAMMNIIPGDRKVPAHFRVNELPTEPDIARIEIRDLRAKHVGKFVALEGLIRRVTEVRPRVMNAAFQCERCNTVQFVKQDDIYIKEPLACNQDEGGCGSPSGRTRFKLLTELPPHLDRLVGDKEGKNNPSEFVDTQKLEIQESPEGLRGGEQPKRLDIYLEDDLTGIIQPGDRVVLNGMLRSRQRGKGSSKSTFFDLFLEVNSIDTLGQEFEEIDITKDDEKAIKKLARSKHLRKNVVGSIAPSIYGMPIEKEAIALQLFGGIPKIMSDKNRARGDIHILLVGDPGVAKSQLLAYVAKLAPRGIYASGKSASAAGLTAAAIRSDEFGEGRWTLEAGALVLADRGVACIDELDKMSEKDRDSMHTAMEQQQISVAKAGITATLQTRCAILAAANPTLGRFDPHKHLPEQIELDPPLLTRFDVIFTITDKVDEAQDRSLADHILKLHFAGEAAQYRELTEDETFKEEEDKVNIEKAPPLEVQFLRKFIAYARRNCFPIMTPEAMTLMNDTYVKARRRSEGGAIQMTPRNIEAMIRLSEASARMRLKKRVEVEDAEVAIRIVNYFLQSVASEDGTIDTDIITTGFGASQRDRIWTLLEIIKDIQGTDGARMDDIMRIAEERGVPGAKVNDDLERLKREGRIYEKYEDRYRLA